MFVPVRIRRGVRHGVPQTHSASEQGTGRDDAELRRRLTPLQYEVMQHETPEAPFDNEFCDEEAEALRPTRGRTVSGLRATMNRLPRSMPWMIVSHPGPVKVGTKVTWANKDSVPHTVVSTNNLSTSAATTNPFAGNTLGQGQTFSFTWRSGAPRP